MKRVSKRKRIDVNHIAFNATFEWLGVRLN